MRTKNLSFNEARNLLVSGMCKTCMIMPGQLNIYGGGITPPNKFRLVNGIVTRFFAVGDHPPTKAVDCEYLIEVIE